MKAFITGATSGIGKALAKLLFSKGWILVLSGRNENTLKKISSELNASFVVADLLNSDDRRLLIENVKTELPDLFVNCAGYTTYGETLSLATLDQMEIFSLNSSIPIELSLEVARVLLSACRGGTIVNISSVAGERPLCGMGLYVPAKAALTSFSQMLNKELRSKGIDVLVSCPGVVATDFANRAARKAVKLSGFFVMSADYAAKQILKQIEQKKNKHVFNWFYRWSYMFVPQFIITALVGYSLRRRAR